MGEAKRRRERGTSPKMIDKNISVCDTAQEALERLGGVEAGTPVGVTLLGAGLVSRGALSGTLGKIILAKEATTERHLYRYAFGIWDRIRTGEHNPWQCTLCARDYSGLPMLSVFAMIDHARGAPVPGKPALMALVCVDCDSVSTDETKRRIEERFRLLPTQEGHA